MSRDVWVTTMTERLAEALGDDYSEGECRALAAFLWGVDPDDATSKTAILRELLMLQGLAPETAGMLARLLPQLNWDRLLSTTRATMTVLDVSKSTIANRAREHPMPHFLRVPDTKWRREFVFWLHEVLFMARWRDAHPYTGGHGRVGWPD